MSHREEESDLKAFPAFCENCGVIVMDADATAADDAPCEDCDGGYLTVMSGGATQLFEKLTERDMKLVHVAAAERILSSGA